MTAKENIKVLIADDSAIMRLITAELLKAQQDIEVVGFAAHGLEAIAKCAALKPNVVVMDMLMGEADGIVGVKGIMANCPTPIIILSSLENTEATGVIEALDAGAVDYHQKPNRSLPNFKEIDKEFILKIRSAAEASIEAVIHKKDLHANQNAHTFSSRLSYEVIVIGSSTGGPSAVEAVITKLPKNLSVPVLIAQHMPANFVPSFAQRLNQLTDLEVTMAMKDDVVEPGKILIAPGSRNMIVRKNIANNQVVCDFTSKQFKEFNGPSVDALMLSVADIFKEKTLGVILTGMGRDGAEGMKTIKNAGGYTIAQNKETCVVYGMPGTAVEMGAINKIVSIEDIGPFIVSCLESEK